MADSKMSETNYKEALELATLDDAVRELERGNFKHVNTIENNISTCAHDSRQILKHIDQLQAENEKLKTSLAEAAKEIAKDVIELTALRAERDEAVKVMQVVLNNYTSPESPVILASYLESKHPKRGEVE